MEEEIGIKVTRLRRRLSVEAEDVKSPSTPSTPTKKRGGRLAAKPQLELIDENETPKDVPKTTRTRKSTVRDTEPEEKAVTPSRRSTRIRSNTSIVSETPLETEDKGTPSRRSTRIKSNTSLIAETVQVTDSPRAKRAARRTSQVGSDNEAPITPARQTRRTRKDSASSIDKQVETAAGKNTQVKEIIVEEAENVVDSTQKTPVKESTETPTRRSPRLNDKTAVKTVTPDKNDNKENDPLTAKEITNSEIFNSSVSATTKPDLNDKAAEDNNLSVSSTNLIKELDSKPKKGNANLNKTTSAIEENPSKSKRHRTKSWTTISSSSYENNFLSDTETITKSKRKNSVHNLSSGDGLLNVSNKSIKKDKNKEDKEVSLNSSTITNHNKNKSITVDTETSINKSTVEMKEYSVVITKEDKQTIQKESPTDKLFREAPTGDVQSVVYIDDSDTNSIEKENITKDSGDQCVPVVEHPLGHETSKSNENNTSVEPMDIDETIPANVSNIIFSEKDSSVNLDKDFELKDRKSLQNVQIINDKNTPLNKSGRKSKTSDDIMDQDTNTSSGKMSASHLVDNVDSTSILTSSQTAANESMSVNNSETARKSLANNVDTEVSTSTDKINKSSRKSSISNEDCSKSVSKRKSSISNNASTDNAIMNESGNKSKNKSLVVNSNDIEMVSDVVVLDEVDGLTNKSEVIVNEDDKVNNKSKNKSKRKSSISITISDDNSDASSKKSNRKSTTLDDTNKETMDKSSNKSVRTSSSNIDVEDNMNKSKSKRKSSISQIASQSFDKTSNSNKSTLVLSQIKDTSEANVINSEPKEANELNDQLSKSVNVPNKEKESDKKNLSLTYSTSTPLQQKSLRKLGMQINTSMITPTSSKKPEKKGALDRSKHVSVLSQNDEESGTEDEEDSDEEDSEEEESKDSSKMIDDEADEASDDYESGDSRDDEEREYEAQNEIVERGETLDSDEEEFSDDSEYEKDSFIVDSDDEDNELLSGSGDDLSMSDNELSMSAKSKKKFNERKSKEQKKASREMYEARHKLDESDKSAKSGKVKKSNRQLIESDSDEEIDVQPKKSRRARIDSSQDISMTQSDADKSVSKKKKKVKPLSESMCEDEPNNEKEMTIQETAEAETVDPLSLRNAVKEEPKTPKKDLNISTVAITNIEEVEKVQVDENASIMQLNQTSDPLHATVAQDDDMEDENSEDSISENEEITQNYEDVLTQLNKKTKKIKASDISLNLDKKTKEKKTKEPIVDQLNLTHVKKTKQKKAEVQDETKCKKMIDEQSLISKIIKNKSINIQDESSSDSIDMKLLFNEDSTDSDIKGKEPEKSKNAEEEFIPLKRTEGKTNILETSNVANTENNDSTLNVSKSKKNKRKSLHPEDTTETNDQEVESLNFFIDTAGAYADVNQSVNTSVKGSAKKNKQQNNVSFANIEEDTAPLETSYKSEKKKNKSKVQMNITLTDEINSSVNEPVSDKKKKKNKSFNNSQMNTDEPSIDLTDDAPLEVSNKGENNKSKQELNVTLAEETNVDGSINESISLSGKKKNKKNKKGNNSQIVSEEQHIDLTDETAAEIAIQNRSVQELNITLGEEKDPPASETQSAKKKKKKNKKGLETSQVSPDTQNIEETGDNVLNVSNKSEKNMSKQELSSTLIEETKIDTTLNASVSQSAKKKKKNKKGLNESSQINDEEQHVELTEAAVEATHNVSTNSSKKQNTISESSTTEKETNNEGEKEITKSKKRKRNQSIGETAAKEHAIDEASKSLNESVAITNQKKKRKIIHNDEATDVTAQDVSEKHDSAKEQLTVTKSNKKNKVQEPKPQEHSANEPVKKSKKRKERDDDECDQLTKVIKQDSFDKVHVARLPEDLIKQLDDKPKTDVGSKRKIISTTSFKVEETRQRRSKPSNYLEESVYLNDSLEDRKRKSLLKKPKVLPFMPTASTSDSGFTTKFTINTLPKETKFVAQASNIANFKNELLQKNRIKKMGTLELYKRHRNIKISKF